MAQRDRDKVKRGAARPSDNVPGLIDAVERLEARAKALEIERDGLKSALEAARARIATLEESGRQVAHRIDWVIDSLHSLADKNA